MPTIEWLNKYESIKDKLTCKTDLDAYFTKKVVGNMGVDVLDIGTIHFPTGVIFACDPLVDLEDTPPFMQTIPVGTYPVKICVVPSEKYGDRYACIKVEISGEKPVRYELGITGSEDLEEELNEEDYFGFCVDAGMGCIADIQTQAAFKEYWNKRLEEDSDIDPYNDLFCDLLEKNAEAHPKYQEKHGDWLLDIGAGQIDAFREQLKGLPRYFTREQFDSFIEQADLRKYIKSNSTDPKNAITLTIYTQEWIIDSKGKSLYCNPQVGNMWGKLAKLDAAEWSDF